MRRPAVRLVQRCGESDLERPLNRSALAHLDAGHRVRSERRSDRAPVACDHVSASFSRRPLDAVSDRDYSDTTAHLRGASARLEARAGVELDSDHERPHSRSPGGLGTRRQPGLLPLRTGRIPLLLEAVGSMPQPNDQRASRSRFTTFTRRGAASMPTVSRASNCPSDPTGWYSARDRRLLLAVARHAAVARENLRLRARVSEETRIRSHRSSSTPLMTAGNDCCEMRRPTRMWRRLAILCAGDHLVAATRRGDPAHRRRPEAA